MPGRSLRLLSDEELFSELRRLVAQERESTVDVLRHLAEIDRRRAIEKTTTPSLYVYCVRELGYSEGAAYRRIHAARCARDYPRIYVLLKRGRITLTTVSLLAPHLCPGNYRQLLEQASGMTRYEVERLIAALSPQREMREMIRPLGPQLPERLPASPDAELPMLSGGEPAPTAAPCAQPEEPAPVSTPAMAAAPEVRRVEFRFAADEGFLAKVRRAQEILRHKHPRGRLEEILDEAMEALLDKRDPERRLARLAKRRAAAARDGNAAQSQL